MLTDVGRQEPTLNKHFSINPVTGICWINSRHELVAIVLDYNEKNVLIANKIMNPDKDTFGFDYINTTIVSREEYKELVKGCLFFQLRYNHAIP